MDPAVIRLPALLTGVCIVAAAAELARRMSGLLAAFIAGALAATSGILVEYSVNARGYGPVSLMALLMALCTHRICENPRERGPWVWWGLAASVGAFFMPIMLFPAVFFLLVIFVQTRVTFGAAPYARLCATICGSAALTAVLYAPILYFNGWRSLLANKWIAPRPFRVVALELPLAGWQALQHWLRDVSWLWAVAVACGLLASLVVGTRRRTLLLCMPLLLPVAVYLTALVQRVIPFPRVLLFMLPLLLACAGAGLAWLASAPNGTPRRAAAALLVLLVLGLSADAARRTATAPYLISEDPAVMVDAEAIVKDAIAAGLNNDATALVWDERVPTWPPLAYYLCLHCPPGPYFANYMNPSCQQALLVVGAGQTVGRLRADMPSMTTLYGPPSVWRAYPRATVYLVQRTARGGR
jgi:hypothetical protein